MVNSEYDAQSVNSAAPSITSINSLASLLKEKMQVRFTLGIEFVTAFSLLLILKNLHLLIQQALPSMIRKRKKPKDYKIRAFVAILFLVIVFLVSQRTFLHKQFSNQFHIHNFRSAMLTLCTIIK